MLSPILFTDYVDSLLCESGCGCYWHNIFAGVLCYVDLKIFAPSTDGLRKMLEVCEEFVCSHHIRFNPAKTQLANTVLFNCELPLQRDLYFLWSTLDSVIHLGNYLMMNLSVDLDIQMKTMEFINQANTVLSRFNLGDSVLKTHLFQSYRLSFYGGSLLCLSSSQIKALEVSYNNILHRIWSLPITYCFCSFGC